MPLSKLHYVKLYWIAITIESCEQPFGKKMFLDEPLEVLEAGFGDAVMKDAHALNHLALHLLRTPDVVLGQEVVGHCDQRLFRPTLEPIHSATGNEPWELERPRAEPLPDLVGTKMAKHAGNETSFSKCWQLQWTWHEASFFKYLNVDFSIFLILIF